MTDIVAFFYGILMHPKILQDVIGNDGVHLQLCPAILLEHTRHKVKNADYPGTIPYVKSRSLFDRELEREERSVRGTLVKGLTQDEIKLLDAFEGDEYTRDLVFVHPLGPLISFSAFSLDEDAVIPSKPPPLPEASVLPSATEANVYIYTDPLSKVEAELWSFEDFVKNHGSEWYGKEVEMNEIERRRREVAGLINS